MNNNHLQIISQFFPNYLNAYNKGNVELQFQEFQKITPAVLQTVDAEIVKITNHVPENSPLDPNFTLEDYERAIVFIYAIFRDGSLWSRELGSVFKHEVDLYSREIDYADEKLLGSVIEQKEHPSINALHSAVPLHRELCNQLQFANEMYLSSHLEYPTIFLTVPTLIMPEKFAMPSRAPMPTICNLANALCVNSNLRVWETCFGLENESLVYSPIELQVNPYNIWMSLTDDKKNALQRTFDIKVDVQYMKDNYNTQLAYLLKSVDESRWLELTNFFERVIGVKNIFGDTACVADVLADDFLSSQQEVLLMLLKEKGWLKKHIHHAQNLADLFINLFVDYGEDNERTLINILNTWQWTTLKELFKTSDDLCCVLGSMHLINRDVFFNLLVKLNDDAKDQAAITQANYEDIWEVILKNADDVRMLLDSLPDATHSDFLTHVDLSDLVNVMRDVVTILQGTDQNHQISLLTRLDLILKTQDAKSHWADPKKIGFLYNGINEEKGYELLTYLHNTSSLAVLNSTQRLLDAFSVMSKEAFKLFLTVADKEPFNVLRDVCKDADGLTELLDGLHRVKPEYVAIFIRSQGTKQLFESLVTDVNSLTIQR